MIRSLEKLLSHAHKGATARTVIFRSVDPKASFTDYTSFMAHHPLHEELGTARLDQLYRDYPADRYDLSEIAVMFRGLILWNCGLPAICKPIRTPRAAPFRKSASRCGLKAMRGCSVPT